MPGSKSFSNRALVMAALTDGRTILRGVSLSDDTRVMINALKKLGIRITKVGDKTKIVGNGGRFKPFNGRINVGPAGTTFRFLAALSVLTPGEITLDGSRRMRKRPIGDLVKALGSLGAEIKYLAEKNCPPIKIIGGKITGGEVKMPGKVSSQFFTSLLLIAPALKRGLNIKVLGKQVSKSFIDMTLESLKEHGVFVKNNNYKRYSVSPVARYSPGQYRIEGDASGASYFWALASITGSRIKVKNIPPNSSQGDAKFPDLLKRMGAKVIKNKKENWIEVKGPATLKGIKVNMEDMPDTAQTLAVVAAFSKGSTKITGLSTLRHKETDRLSALKTELKKMGIRSAISHDSITIQGGNPRGAKISTYNDHRMAMSFAIAGAKIPGMVIKNPEVVSKSFPEFWNIIKSAGIKLA